MAYASNRIVPARRNDIVAAGMEARSHGADWSESLRSQLANSSVKTRLNGDAVGQRSGSAAMSPPARVGKTNTASRRRAQLRARQSTLGDYEVTRNVKLRSTARLATSSAACASVADEDERTGIAEGERKYKAIFRHILISRDSSDTVCCLPYVACDFTGRLPARSMIGILWPYEIVTVLEKRGTELYCMRHSVHEAVRGWADEFAGQSDTQGNPVAALTRIDPGRLATTEPSQASRPSSAGSGVSRRRQQQLQEQQQHRPTRRRVASLRGGGRHSSQAVASMMQ